MQRGVRATTLYAGGGPGVSRRESCVAADAAARAVDCGMRTPSNDPIGGVLPGWPRGGWTVQRGVRATTLYAGGGPAAGRIAAESCVTADLVGRAVDCGMRTPSNDPIRGRWTGRIAAESCVAADLVGKAGLRNGDAEQRPYTRPAGRGMSRR